MLGLPVNFRPSRGWPPAPSLPLLRPHQLRTSRAGAGVFLSQGLVPGLPRGVPARILPSSLPSMAYPPARPSAWASACTTCCFDFRGLVTLVLTRACPCQVTPVGTSRAIPVPDGAWGLLLHLVWSLPTPAARTHGRPLVPRPVALLDRPDHHCEPHGLTSQRVSGRCPGQSCPGGSGPSW
jgi:hypothetical protein